MLGWGSGSAYFNRTSWKGLWLWLPLLWPRQKRLHQRCNIDCLKHRRPKAMHKEDDAEHVARRATSTVLGNLKSARLDSAVSETVNYVHKPIVANAPEFPEHWSHWGKFFFSHLLAIYLFVTVAYDDHNNNNNNNNMLYLDFEGGVGRWWLWSNYSKR